MKTEIFTGWALSPPNAQKNAHDLCEAWILAQRLPVVELSRRVLDLKPKDGSMQWYCNLELSYKEADRT